MLEGRCARQPEICPLSQVRVGTTVCIKRLSTPPELSDRLRELGFCEQQKIRVIARESNLICQVCNSRLGISPKLAESIMVQAITVAAPRRAA
jgi:Fe2+ transport system protein FeoA